VTSVGVRGVSFEEKGEEVRVSASDEKLLDMLTRLFQLMEDLNEYLRTEYGEELTILPDPESILRELFNAEVVDDGQCFVVRGRGVEFCVDELSNRWYWDWSDE